VSQATVPLARVAHRPGLDRVTDELSKGLDRSLGSQERVLPRTSLVENLTRPSTKGFGGQRHQPVKLLKEPGQHAAHVRDDLVRMGAH